MKLYTGPLSNFGLKTEIAAREKGIALDIEMVPFTLATRYQPRHPEVLRINPKEQVPVLVDGDLDLFDSTQICEYFEDIKPTPALWPATPKGRARARLMELRVDEIFFGEIIKLLQFPPPGPERDASLAKVNAFYNWLNERLAKSDYLAGEFSYADISFFIAQFFAGLVGAAFPEDLTHLAAWRQRVGKREHIAPIARRTFDYLASNGIKMSPSLIAA